MRAIRMLLVPTAAIALIVALLLAPAPWRPPRILHGVVESAEFGRAGRWTAGSRAILRVRLVDGSRVECTADLTALPHTGEVILLRRRVGLFGQTLDITLAPPGTVAPTD
jgi:hypothetical protein